MRKLIFADLLAGLGGHFLAEKGRENKTREGRRRKRRLRKEGDGD